MLIDQSLSDELSNQIIHTLVCLHLYVCIYIIDITVIKLSQSYWHGSIKYPLSFNFNQISITIFPGVPGYMYWYAGEFKFLLEVTVPANGLYGQVI